MKTTIKEKVYINRQSKEQACNFEISRNTLSVKNVLKANNSDNTLAKLMSYNDVMMDDGLAGRRCGKYATVF